MEQNLNEFGGRDIELEEKLEANFLPLLQPVLEYLQQLCDEGHEPIRVFHNADREFEHQTSKMLNHMRSQMDDINLNEGQQKILDTFKRFIK